MDLERNAAALRAQLAKVLDWEDTHLSIERAIEGVPPAVRGVAPKGLPYSPWQLLEHLRRTQLDVLDFCRNPDYREPRPEEYWPPSAAPSSAAAWDESVQGFLRDRAALQRLAMDPKVDLFARIPHGSGQTYLREVLVIADHNSYHVGQLVAVRRALGAWSAE